MPQSVLQQRAAPRFGLALPVTLDGRPCACHDISATGVLLQSDRPVASGSRVHLHLRPGPGTGLDCSGQVVRSDARGDSWNVAVRLDRPLFDQAALQEGGTG